jgi:hypothetical protein
MNEARWIVAAALSLLLAWLFKHEFAMEAA